MSRLSVHYLGEKNNILPSTQSSHFAYLTQNQYKKNIPISFRVENPSYNADLKLLNYKLKSDLIKSNFLLVHRLDYIKRRYLKKYENEWQKFQLKTRGGYSCFLNKNFIFVMDCKTKYRKYKRFLFLKKNLAFFHKKKNLFFYEKMNFYQSTLFLSKSFFLSQKYLNKK
jgi:hypothetical protein